MAPKESPPAFVFVARLALVWALAIGAIGVIGVALFSQAAPKIGSFASLLLVVSIAVAVGQGIVHVRRVRLIAGRVDREVLANRHHRRIEVPLDGPAAFDLVEAAIRELPRIKSVDANRQTLRIRALSIPPSPYDGTGMRWNGMVMNEVRAGIEGGSGSSSVTLVCEPASGPWTDWFFTDDGANLESAETVTRSIARRVAERRAVEQAEASRAAAERELAHARLALLQAQVEPHFLYNTLANAQLLTRSDPARADAMLGELITYLRSSLPRADGSPSTMRLELERARAYLELMKIRMGERLKVEIGIEADAEQVRIPAMIVQTLVENAIKHGLEPKPGGGTLWIGAQCREGAVEIRVADDGLGFGSDTKGSGIGLKNARERLRLAYGDGASLELTPNYPAGVTATLRIPFAGAPAPATQDPER
jgi:signal transduction histidine kinase